MRKGPCKTMASTIVMILCPSPEGSMIIYLGNHVQGKGEYSFQKLGVNIDAWFTVSQFSVWSQLMVISLVPEWNKELAEPQYSFLGL